MIDANKSVYEQVIYQSDTERTFAEQLEKNEAIKVYAKLPGWFRVPTPLGPYNPDWAVLVEKDGAERLYFVVETKSSLFTDDLRDKESAQDRMRQGALQGAGGWRIYAGPSVGCRSLAIVCCVVAKLLPFLFQLVGFCARPALDYPY